MKSLLKEYSERLDSLDPEALSEEDRKELLEGLKKLERLQKSNRGEEAEKAAVSADDGITRIALVIGNASYGHGKEEYSSINDARAVAAGLRAAGFEVMELTNATLGLMKARVRKLGRELRASNSSTVEGVFYFSGHGVNSNGVNYLVPIGAIGAVRSPRDLNRQLLRVEYVNAVLRKAGNASNVVILDASRGNPFGDLAGGELRAGMAPTRGPNGTLTAYAAGSGQSVIHGGGPTSHYAGALLKELAIANMPADLAFKRARLAVMEATGGRQKPVHFSQLKAPFCFKGHPGGRIELPYPVAVSASRVLSFKGSNTIGDKLIPAIAEKYLIGKGGGKLQWLPSEAAGQQILSVGKPGDNLPEMIMIEALGSSTGFKALAAGNADIVMSSRPAKEKERKALGNLKEFIVALDGVAVIANPVNPAEYLTIEDVRRIFCGHVDDWLKVGGFPCPITVNARDDDSGTYAVFRNRVLDTCDLRGDANRFYSNADLSDFVSRDESAIGFVGLAYVKRSKLLRIKESMLLYTPTPFTVKTEEYPLARRLFLYVPEATYQDNELVRDFVEFAVSGEVQELVREEGFVDLSVEPAPPTPVESTGSRLYAAKRELRRYENFKKFRSVFHQADRLSTTFRFMKGSSELEPRAIQDVERLVNYLNDRGIPGDRLLLAGFADNEGDYDDNLRLSEQRARAVWRYLKALGIEARLMAFGEEAPVAANTTPEGRWKNRRVESWLLRDRHAKQ